MTFVRGIGWILAVAGFALLGRDLIAWRDAPVFAPLSLYELWLELARTSLLRVENALAPYLWRMLRDALGLWAAPALVVPGLALVWAGRPDEPRRRRRRR